MVNKGLIKRVGSRSSISVWNDPWLPTTRPRLANKNQHLSNFSPDLIVASFINATSLTWNSQAIRSMVDEKDAQIIESIPLNRYHMVDRDGWHFTNNGRNIVKSGYQIKRVYLDREVPLQLYGPNVNPLKAFSWKIRCFPKIKHFLWHILS